MISGRKRPTWTSAAGLESRLTSGIDPTAGLHLKAGQTSLRNQGNGDAQGEGIGEGRFQPMRQSGIMNASFNLDAQFGEGAVVLDWDAVLTDGVEAAQNVLYGAGIHVHAAHD